MEEVKQILTDYLEHKGLRKTPERFAILEEIYSNSGHFVSLCSSSIES